MFNFSGYSASATALDMSALMVMLGRTGTAGGASQEAAGS